jgi:hypothetical protein
VVTIRGKRKELPYAMLFGIFVRVLSGIVLPLCIGVGAAIPRVGVERSDRDK